jgi:hypothetical protein
MSAEQWFMPLFGMSFFGFCLIMAALFVILSPRVFRDPRMQGSHREFWRGIRSHSDYVKRLEVSRASGEEALRDIRRQYFATRVGGIHGVLLAIFFGLTVIFGLCEFVAHGGQDHLAKTGESAVVQSSMN